MGSERIVDWMGANMNNDTTDAPKTSMRMQDLRLTVELLGEAVEQERGARERIAERYGIRKSVITNRVDRMETFFGVMLFTGPQRKTPTAAGRVMARYGPRLIQEFEEFAGMLQDASKPDEVA
jgi:hypothetical protein